MEYDVDLLKLNEQRSAELKNIIGPVEEFMNKWCCPHDVLVVTQGRAELFCGTLSIPLKLLD